MNQIILASHSKLASGMALTVQFFGGMPVVVLEQTMNDSGFEGKVVEVLERYKDKNCIVFTDMLGGSVNQMFSKYLSKYNFQLITGMNLSIILECMFTQQDIDANFIRQAMSASKLQFAYMNDYLVQVSNDDEDE